MLRDRCMRWMEVLGMVAAVATSFWINHALADGSDNVNGGEIYDSYCSACHGFDGRPLLANVPNFALGERLGKPDAELLNSIQAGKGKTMPSWLGILDDKECEEVLEFIRNGIKSESNADH